MVTASASPSSMSSRLPARTPLAIVDLETTGTHAGGYRITEIGIVRVDPGDHGGVAHIDEWSTLVDPQVAIPPAIQVLTGISDTMVRGAPCFEHVADQVAARV